MLGLLLAGAAARVLLGLLAYGLNATNRWAHRHLPSPRPAWLLGNLGQLGPPGKSHTVLQRWALQHGPCAVVYLGRQPCVLLSGAASGAGLWEGALYGQLAGCVPQAGRPGRWAALWALRTTTAHWLLFSLPQTLSL